MLLTSTDNVKHFFKEDVAVFFDEKGIFPVPDVKIVGKSKLEHNFDFVFSKNRKHKERLVKVINSNSKDKFLATVYSFNDVKNRNAENIIIFNDMINKLNEDIQNLLEKENIEVINWSNKKTIEEKLGA